MSGMINETMMQGMGWGAMTICMLFALLFLIVLVLAIMALLRYLRKSE